MFMFVYIVGAYQFSRSFFVLITVFDIQISTYILKYFTLFFFSFLELNAGIEWPLTLILCRMNVHETDLNKQ